MFRRQPRKRALYVCSAMAFAAAAGTMLSCSDSTAPDKSGTFYGSATTLASGNARAFVILDAAGAPTDLGVSFTEGALTGLPLVSTEYMVELPKEATATVYKHLTVNWQPAGHGMMGTVYALPHFDLHIYMITQAERTVMTTGTPELTAKMVRPPAAEFIAPGYAVGPVVQQMGMHWTDLNAPEVNGQVFIKTFFYGSYDGVFMLHEPMVTKAFMELKQPNVITPIKLPAQYATRGYHATSYTVSYDATAKEYRIGLSGLTLR
jgi:hypothetical protein